jgi:hypothetical protein
MSEESKKIEEKAEQTEQEVKAAELSDKDLDKVAGGGGIIAPPASPGGTVVPASRRNPFTPPAPPRRHP